MRFSIILIIIIINQGCENNTNNKNTNKKNSTYLCAKCGSLLYDGSEMFYENGSSKDFNNSIEKKVKIGGFLVIVGVILIIVGYTITFVLGAIAIITGIIFAGIGLSSFQKLSKTFKMDPKCKIIRK